MELVQTTRGIVSHSPRATVVTVAACAVAVVALALLLAGVGSRGSTVPPPAPITSGGLTPQEWRYVQGIESLSPAQVAAAFGTGRTAATPASLTPQERLEVESIMALTPAQLRAAYGTGGNR